jgi:hypothetical protein
VYSAAAVGITVAAGKAAETAAVEMIPFINARLEKSELMEISPWGSVLFRSMAVSEQTPIS